MIATIKLFEALKTKFGEAEAKVIVEEIEKIETNVELKVEKAFADKKDILATKEDLAKLEARINNKFNDLLKWMIIMWITQLGAIMAIIKLFH